VLAALQWNLVLVFAHSAFQTKHNLLGSLGFLVEYWLGLTTETRLLTTITTFTLGVFGTLTLLVLRYLVWGVLAALLALTERVAGLWNIDLKQQSQFNYNYTSLPFCISGKEARHAQTSDTV
jgi:hypothetical protein